MILTDREIQTALDASQIEIDPLPDPDAYSSTSLDLTLDSEITLFDAPAPGVNIHLNPNDPNFHPEYSLAPFTTKKVMGNDGFLLNPHVLVLGYTKERVRLNLAGRVAARVEGKSSLARIGLGIHITAPTIHAGFNFRLRLEIVNHGLFPILLTPGMRICQLIFEQTLGTPVKGYSGKFFSQEAPV